MINLTENKRNIGSKRIESKFEKGISDSAEVGRRIQNLGQL